MKMFAFYLIYINAIANKEESEHGFGVIEKDALDSAQEWFQRMEQA